MDKSIVQKCGVSVMHKQLFELNGVALSKLLVELKSPQHAIKVQILSSSMKLSFLLLPLNKFGGTGPVLGGAGWFLVVMAQYGAVLVGTW